MAIELQSETAPATPATGYGRVFYDALKRLKSLDEFGLNTAIPSVMGTTITSVSSTTTAETKSLIGTITGTFTVPANHMIIGQTLRFRARGVITTGITASTITWFLKYAGTTIASTGALAPTVSQSNMYWEAEAEITCRTVGASGTFMVQGKLNIQMAAAPSAGQRWPIRGNSADPPAVVTVDTTASSLVDFQTTTGNNLHTITCNMAVLEILN